MTMKNTIPEIDAYIDESAAFAQPILKKLRNLFHAACPEIQETIKWNSPSFESKGIVGNMTTLATFEGFSDSKRKDYVEWITEAKREATRDMRMVTAMEWLAEGKPRNWKYMKEWR
jgi:hypothetical protein